MFFRILGTEVLLTRAFITGRRFYVDRNADTIDCRIGPLYGSITFGGIKKHADTLLKLGVAIALAGSVTFAEGLHWQCGASTAGDGSFRVCFDASPD